MSAPVRPILFSAPMVRAILDGRKTQTRRVLKPQPMMTNPRFGTVLPYQRVLAYEEANAIGTGVITLPYAPGDLLWVRESYCDPEGSHKPVYKADLTAEQDREQDRVNRICRGLKGIAQPWKPSIHMPRWASRITLEVTGVKVERLQDISEDDAKAEGVPEWLEANTDDELYCATCRGHGVHAALGANYGVTEVDCAECDTYVKRFRHLWNGINAERGFGWKTNPWVTAVTFRPIMQNIDAVLGTEGAAT